MATIKLWTDEMVSADPRVKSVFDDIRSTRNSDFVNNVWRALANQPALLERTWSSVKDVMIAPSKLDPLTKEPDLYRRLHCQCMQLLHSI